MVELATLSGTGKSPASDLRRQIYSLDRAKIEKVKLLASERADQAKDEADIAENLYLFAEACAYLGALEQSDSGRSANPRTQEVAEAYRRIIGRCPAYGGKARNELARIYLNDTGKEDLALSIVCDPYPRSVPPRDKGDGTEHGRLLLKGITLILQGRIDEGLAHLYDTFGEGYKTSDAGSLEDLDHLQILAKRKFYLPQTAIEKLVSLIDQCEFFDPFNDRKKKIKKLRRALLEPKRWQFWRR